MKKVRIKCQFPNGTTLQEGDICEVQSLCGFDFNVKDPRTPNTTWFIYANQCEEYVENSSGVNSIVQLKASGFSVDEIIRLKREGVI